MDIRIGSRKITALGRSNQDLKEPTPKRHDIAAGGSPPPAACTADKKRGISVDLDPNDLDALKRILASIAGADPLTEEVGEQDSGMRVAQLVFASRQARSRLFPASMFNEPAWDMLMALYIADEVPAAADLARWTNTPLTTAMRWIEYLETHKLIKRETSPDDRRAHTVRLTDEARQKMQVLFSDLETGWR